MKSRSKLAQFGFTMTELMISVVVASILALIMITVTVYFYGDTARLQATAELAVESQSVLRRMVDDIRTANGIHSTNLLTDANQPSGGWQTSDPNNVLIVASPAIDSSHNIIYDSADGFPYQNETIYWNSGKNMYRRTLKNTAATGNVAVTTCPQSAATASCPADIKLSSYLTNLQFVFYDIDNNVTTVAENARSVSITLSLTRRISGKDVAFNNTIRTTLRNY